MCRRFAALSTADTEAEERDAALQRVRSALSPASPRVASFLAAQRAVLEANQVPLSG